MSLVVPKKKKNIENENKEKVCHWAKKKKKKNAFESSSNPLPFPKALVALLLFGSQPLCLYDAIVCLNGLKRRLKPYIDNHNNYGYATEICPKV